MCADASAHIQPRTAGDIFGGVTAAADDTGLLTARVREYSFQRFRVVVTRGPDEGKTAQSDGPEFTIGTGEGNHLILRDGTVSRHHCSISSMPRGFLLRDLASTNGTKLADYRVEGAYLKPGAIIGVGMTQIQFAAMDEVVREPIGDQEQFGGALGSSPAMRHLFTILPRVAQSSSTVLLEGETGTGKGLLADAIHAASPRSSGPFAVLDCSVIPPTLIEAELFGHERGAFTSAHTARQGVLETANGGTLFLDEIGELPLEMQPKLLRVLEERTMKRIGSREPVKIDVRVIAATNRDLRTQVNQGTFRGDLYYRLKVVTFRLPPLRERPEDIRLLTRHFYKQFVDDAAEPPKELLDSFARRRWPGNVRELRNAVERAVLLGFPPSGLQLSEPPSSRYPQAGSAEFDPSLPFRIAKEKAVAAWEQQYVQWLLARHGGNLSRAAREAHTDRNYLRELARRHNITTGVE
jgi:DNA-binding NtrC family response regulator